MQYYQWSIIIGFIVIYWNHTDSLIGNVLLLLFIINLFLLLIFFCSSYQ